MVVIGKRSAIASMYDIHLHGVFAWILWRVIYLSKILRLDKKVRIFLD